MKKYVFALASAILLSAVITELHARVFPHQPFALFLLTAIAIFLVAMGTTIVVAASDARAVDAAPAEERRADRRVHADRTNAVPDARPTAAPPARDTAEAVAGGDGRESGTVKWFNRNKGYGFIARDSGGEIFVHYKAIRGSGRRSLRDGQRVTFAVVGHDKGLQADDVSTVRGEQDPA
jgi:cold shock protein